MAKLDDCIQLKAAEGKIPKIKARQVTEEFEQRVKDVADDERLSTGEAERAVASRLVERKERELNRRKTNARNQMAIQADIVEWVKKAKEQGFPIDRVIYGRLGFDVRREYTGLSVEVQKNVELGILHSRMAEAIEKYRPKTAGLRQNTDGLEDVIAVMHGEKIDNEASTAIGRGARDAVEHGTERFNSVGGDIKLRKNYGLHHTHDQFKVTQVTPKVWQQFVIDRLKLDEMVDEGGNHMTRNQVWFALGEMHEEIRTGGLSELSNLTPKGAGSSVNKRANSRFLIFRDSKAWVEYHKKFGRGTLYDSITSSLQAIARDTAVLRVLGPHPDATLRFMEKQLDLDAAVSSRGKTGVAAARLVDKIGGPKAQLKALFNVSIGRGSLTDNGLVASISQGNRNLVVSTTLGGAFWSAIADQATIAITARMSGMPVVRTLSQALKTFVTNSTEDRLLALRLGMVVDSWTSKAIGVKRIMGEVAGPEWTERFADTVMKATFLSPLTEAGRIGFQLQLLSHVTANARRAFSNLDPALRHSFSRHGIDEGMWDTIRKTNQWVDPVSGASWLRPEDIMRGKLSGAEFDAANALQNMIYIERRFAIVEVGDTARAFFTAGLPSGTFMGEMLRNSAMFKSFPLEIVRLHWQRGIAADNPVSRLQYFSWLVLGATTMGALGEQMTQISRGRDPLDMTDSQFWGRAFLRGGSAGLFGDLILRDQSRFGGSIAEDLLGPVVGQIDDLTSLTAGNISELLSGEETHAGRELARFIEANTPGRSAWQVRLAMERVIFDTLDNMLDPNARQSRKRLEQKLKSDSDQRFWSRPGSLLNARTPDFSGAIGR